MIVVTEVTVIAIAVELTRDALARTLTESSTMTTVGTSHIFGPLITGGSIGTLVTIITVTLIGVWFTSVTGCSRCTCVGVGVHTTVSACTGSPSTILQSLLHTGVNVGGTATFHTVVVGFAIVITLTVASTFTTTRTEVGLGSSIAVCAFGTIVTGTTIAVVASR